MDNARWLVILSVVVSMMTTLTILNRYSPRQQPEKVATVTEGAAGVQQRPAEINKPVVNRPSRREVPKFGQISFPKPAAHTIAVDQPRDIEKMNESLKDEGNIIR